MTSIINAFVEVWEQLVTFLTANFSNIIALFYNAETGLTFVGVLAVIMGGISLILLIWNLIRSFFSMHG